MFDTVFMLHDHQYLHRDLKPSNYMYKLTTAGDLRIALVDFGSSIRIGEPNSTEFRGTGAYGPITYDPMQSKPMDDLWSVIFSILDLCIPGGLPWRSTSARTAQGREEITLQKLELMNAIKIDDLTNSFVTGLPELVKQVIRELLSVAEDQESVEIFRKNFQNIFSHKKFPITKFISMYLEPPALRVSIPRNIQLKTTAANFLLHGENRNLLIEAGEMPPYNSSIFFNIPPNRATDITDKISAILHTAVGSMPSARRMRVCLLEIGTGYCDTPDCPLLHVPARGIKRSAIIRSLTVQSSVCTDHLIEGKCNSRICPKSLHLTDADIQGIYNESADLDFPNKCRRTN